MTEYEKMLAGHLYDPADAKLCTMRATARELTYSLNHSKPSEKVKREQLLRNLFGSAGKHLNIEPSFNCDYGQNIHVGEQFFMNFGGVILDCAEVRIGDCCFIGPQVGIYTATHPLDIEQRNRGLELAQTVSIGNNCWIGGHATINPGVSLGNNVVVASGSVVTKSFADNVIIAGNPARIIKGTSKKSDMPLRSLKSSVARR